MVNLSLSLLYMYGVHNSLTMIVLIDHGVNALFMTHDHKTSEVLELSTKTASS